MPSTCVGSRSHQTTAEQETIIQNTTPIAHDVTLTSPASMMDVLYCEPFSQTTTMTLSFISMNGLSLAHSSITRTHSSTHKTRCLGSYRVMKCHVLQLQQMEMTQGTPSYPIQLPYCLRISPLDGSILLHETPVSGIVMSSNTLSVGTDTSSQIDGTYGLSIPTLSGSIVYADIDNDVVPQSFSLNIDDGTHQTQDIALIDTHFHVQTDTFDPDNGYVDFNFAATMQHSDIIVDQALQYRTLYPAGEEDWILVSLSAQQTYSLFTTFAHHTSNTVMFVYNAQGNQVASSVPYLGNDNLIESFSPCSNRRLLHQNRYCRDE